MPEIYEMFINFSELLRFIPQDKADIKEQIIKLENCMEENRLRLFGDISYDSEFAKIY